MKKPIRYVWCAEDEKYGLMGVYATKRAAEKAIGNGEKYWWTGYGGIIVKRKVDA